MVRIVHVRSSPAALVPALPESGEGEGTAFLHVEVVGLFAPVLALPLVESVGRDQAPPPAEGAAEGGLLRGRLAAGVDHARPDPGVVGPRRDEPPPEHLQTPLPFLLQNRGDLLRRGDVVARRKVDRTFVQLELLGQPAGRGRKRIPAAHISHLSKIPKTYCNCTGRGPSPTGRLTRLGMRSTGSLLRLARSWLFRAVPRPPRPRSARSSCTRSLWPRGPKETPGRPVRPPWS